MQTKFLHILQSGVESCGSVMERKITPPHGYYVSEDYLTFSAPRRDDILRHVLIPCGDSGRAFAVYKHFYSLTR